MRVTCKHSTPGAEASRVFKWQTSRRGGKFVSGVSDHTQGLAVQCLGASGGGRDVPPNNSFCFQTVHMENKYGTKHWLHALYSLEFRGQKSSEIRAGKAYRRLFSPSPVPRAHQLLLHCF